jgi:hypothetical protein
MWHKVIEFGAFSMLSLRKKPDAGLDAVASFVPQDLRDALRRFAAPRVTASAMPAWARRPPPGVSPYPSQTPRVTKVKPGRNRAMDSSALSMPIAQANALHDAAYFVLIAGAVLIALATMTLFWTTTIRERFADGRIAEAQARSEQSKAEVARSIVKVASLQVELQQAKVEQEKIKGQLAWRRLTPEQNTMIVNALKGHPMAVYMLAFGNDPEAQQFAADLQKSLESAGCTVTFSIGIFTLPIQGIAMSMSTSPDGSLLYAALRSAGLEPSDLPKKDRIMIVVGSKPSAF